MVAAQQKHLMWWSCRYPVTGFPTGQPRLSGSSVDLTCSNGLKCLAAAEELLVEDLRAFFRRFGEMK